MFTPLRIIHVVNVRWYNATAWYGLSLAELLVRAGHEVRVLALPDTEPWEKARGAMGSASIGININSANVFSTIRSFFLIRNLVREFRPHIVNCHRGEGMPFWGMLKGLGGGFALVRTRGDQRPPRVNPVNRYLYARMADAVIATNSGTERQCAGLGVPASRLHCIPGGVDRRFFSPDPEGRAHVRAQYGFGDKDVVVGLLGRFDPVKGHRELLDAFAAVRAKAGGRYSSLRLMLMGFPANISLEGMRAMLQERDLGDCCRITGKVDNVAAHINAMDLGVIASVGSEAIARAAFEIMSCGVPLIGTDVGVMPDLLSRDALVPVGDAGALAGLLQRTAFEPDFARGLAARQAARMSGFSHEAFLESTLSVYRQALALRRAAWDAT